MIPGGPAGAYEWGMTRTIDRDAIARLLAGCFTGSPGPGVVPGGRTEALRLLEAYDPSGYGRGRNHLQGPVSRLSPYLRHGMVSAVEVRDRLRERFGADPARLEEFFRQLAWRDFFSKVLAWHGRGLEDDIEEPKHPVPRERRLPLDIAEGNTGLPCVDGMLGELYGGGHLHNHARLWFAAYWCHFRGLDWREGARLFRRFLLDGDTASNFSSWQWVEGTFASKPYFMNRENIENFSGGAWCRGCRASCPFDRSYPELQRILFGASLAPLAGLGGSAGVPGPAPEAGGDGPAMPPAAEIVWMHDGAMSRESPAVRANPGAPVVFAFDTPAMRAEPPAWHRVAFMLDGLDDLAARPPGSPVVVVAGEMAEAVGRAARAAGAGTIHLDASAEPAVAEAAARLGERFRVVEHSVAALAVVEGEPRRFSRYWEKAAPQVTGRRAERGARWHR
jgi:deoxyribodipyrimidine photo-lyase